MVDIYLDQEEAARLSGESRWRFHCHAGLACFNQCCRNPTVILKPYDIIRLRRRLGMTSTEFLERYTISVREDKSHLPLVMLDIDREAGTGCPFLAAEGCGVYADRPGACRLFPVIQGSSLGEEGVIDSYFTKQLNFCQGFTAGREWTLAEWQADQGLDPHEELNREWLEIILKRGARNPPADDDRGPALFAIVGYDIDKFRHFVFKTPFLEIYEIPEEVAAVLQESDVELLRFGYKYLKMVLLLEDPQKMKGEMGVVSERLDLARV
jgi:Fe-S-cluster containining protein